MYTIENIRTMIQTRTDGGTFFNYDNLVDIKTKRTKIPIICPLHGEFMQQLYEHVKNAGCFKCRHIGKRKLTKEIFLDKIKTSRTDRGEYYDYSLVPTIIGNNKVRIPIICPIHGIWHQLTQDHIQNFSCRACGTANAHTTKIEKYGSDYRKLFHIEMAKTVKSIYGVENISQNEEIKKKKIATCMEHYGTNHYAQSDIGKANAKKINLIKYGVEYLSQNADIKYKMMQTRIKNGSFDNTNCSKEARTFFRIYWENKGYDISQVAYSDPEYGLFEWGYNIKGKWILYDFVAFEAGHRGDKTKILEIIEYHGPFHYTDDDVNYRGNDMAYPWKSKTVTIQESRNTDIFKEEFANSLTDNFRIIWYNNLPIY